MNENEKTVTVGKDEIERVIAILKEISEKPNPEEYPERLAIVVSNQATLFPNSVCRHHFKIGTIVKWVIDTNNWQDINSTLRQSVNDCDLLIYTR